MAQSSHAARPDPGAELWAPGLVGRESELRLLVQAATRPPAVVILEGEAGVGKTRLVHEALEHEACEGRLRIVGFSQPLHEPLPLAPLVDALHDTAEHLPTRDRMNPIIGALRPLLPELANALPALPEQSDDPRVQRHDLFRGARELLRAFGPLVLVLEDLHWADDITGEFIRFLLVRPPESLSLIFTFRRGGRLPPSPLLRVASRLPAGTLGAHLSLAPLDMPHVRALIAAILQERDVSQEFAEFLFRKTAGIPFAIEEVLRLLQERGGIQHTNNRWIRKALDELAVPPALEDSVRDHLSCLPLDAQHVLKVLAVLNVPAHASLLRHMTGMAPERCAAAIDRGCDSGLVGPLPRGRVAFRHDLGRRAVYESLSPIERRQLHTRAKVALEGESPPPLAQLAHHCKQAGLDSDLVRYASEAADACVAHADDAGAMRLLEAALTVAELAPGTRVSLAEKLATSALRCTPSAGPVEILEEITRADDLTPGLRSRVRFGVARLLASAGAASRAYEELKLAAADLEDAAIAAITMVRLAIPLVREGTVEEHREWLARGMVAAVAAGASPWVKKVAADRAAALLYLGDRAAWSAVAELDEDRDSLAGRWELSRRNYNLGEAAFHLGHHARAESFLIEARNGAGGAPHPRLDLQHSGLQALQDWVAGRWEGLDERARGILEETEDPRPIADALLVMGCLALARGHTGEAREALQRCVDIALPAGSIPVMVKASAALVRIAFVEQTPERARASGRTAFEIVRDKGVWYWVDDLASNMVRAMIAMGCEDEAARLARSVGRGIRAFDAPAARAASAACKGFVASAKGTFDTAARHFSRAEELYRRLPSPYQAAQMAEAAGESMTAAAGEWAAPDSFTRALEGFTSLGATWDASRVRAAMRERGVNVPYPWRGGRRGYGLTLSPRESEIAHLAATRRTNRDIARRLFISPRTVEHHLASAMRKLGVGSRTELAALLDARQ